MEAQEWAARVGPWRAAPAQRQACPGTGVSGQRDQPGTARTVSPLLRGRPLPRGALQ